MQDPQLLLLRTGGGALTTVEVFLNAGYGYDIRCEVVGDRGTVALTNPARVVADGDRRRATGYPADWRPRFAEAYRAELQAWWTRSPPAALALATAGDGLAASAAADAVIAPCVPAAALSPSSRPPSTRPPPDPCRASPPPCPRPGPRHRRRPRPSAGACSAPAGSPAGSSARCNATPASA